MGLKKSYKKFAKKATLRTRIQYEYSLDLWRVNKLSHNFLVKEHKDHRVAVLLSHLITESKEAKLIPVNKTIVSIEGKRIKIQHGDKTITLKQMEKNIYNKTRKKPSLKYQLWIAAKYLS
jgi:hypothetical protein